MKIRRRGKFEADMDVELRFHIDAYVADLIRSGVDRDEAARRARIEFGALEATKDDCRQAWGLRFADDLRTDLRLTFRTLLNNPGFAAVAILSLALGIGANSAIFGLIDAVMLRLLPVQDPASLVFVQTTGTGGSDGPPYPCFELLRDKVRSFESIAAFSGWSAMEVEVGGQRDLARGIWVSGNFYEMLGVKPLLGRTLTRSDDQVTGKGGADGAVIVISRAYWQQQFGGDPAVIGRAIHLFAHPVTIVGVMPSEIMTLEVGTPVDIAAPMMLSDPVKMHDRGALWLEVVARLKPGVPLEQAHAEANTLFQAYMADIEMRPSVRSMLFDHMELRPAARGFNGLRGRFATPLTALMILAGLVLLAACVNVANLMLARAAAREKEFAVRLAIGAGRGRLIRQTLTEALVLVGTGTALGVVLARQGQAALLASFFAEGNNKVVLDLSLNGRILLFTLSVAVLTGLAFGILPALRASQVDPAAGLQSGSRGFTGSRVSLRLGRALVILQVTLSMVLLVGAGLFIRSLWQLQAVDIGFPREGILTMEVTPERSSPGSPEWLASQTAILDRLRQLPAVRAASLATMNPFGGRDRGAVVDISGFAPGTEADRHIHLAAISPGYFETFGMSVLLGRAFTVLDTGPALKVAVINESASQFYFRGANPIGRKVQFTNYPGPLNDRIYEIVGVVKDARHDSLREAPVRFIFLPLPQSIDRINSLSLALRCSGDAASLAAAVRSEIQGVRPTLLIANISTVQKQVEQSLIRERLVSSLSAAFGAAALILAGIGLYGILAYAVARRTNEIGIRMALGATRGAMIWLVLREAFLLASIGMAIGVPAVLALGRITKALFYGVEAFDLPAFASAILLLTAFAAIAGFAPARRASRLNPMSALRCE